MKQGEQLETLADALGEVRGLKLVGDECDEAALDILQVLSRHGVVLEKQSRK